MKLKSISGFLTKPTFTYKNFKNICNLLVHCTMAILPSNILNYFGDHLYDGDHVDGHVNTLIKLILGKYFLIRVHYETKKKADFCSKNRVRNILTKTILFKNQ